MAPRLMFATVGTMLHGSLNTLIDILEKLDTGKNIEGYTKEDLLASSNRDKSLRKRSDFNGKRVRDLEKMDRIKTCSYLVGNFVVLFHRAHIFEKYTGIVELRHIFVRLVSFNFKLRISAVKSLSV